MTGQELFAHLAQGDELAQLRAERDEATSRWADAAEAATARGIEIERLNRERDALRARDRASAGAVEAARSLRGHCDWLEARVVELEAERDALRARVAELEAPPVVPEGWQLRKIGAPEWRKWDALRDGKLTSWCGHVGDLPIVRALAWAIEHDKRPPHAEDVEDSGDVVGEKDEVV